MPEPDHDDPRECCYQDGYNAGQDEAYGRGRADERERWRQAIVRKSGIPKRGDTHAECFVPLALLDGDGGA